MTETLSSLAISVRGITKVYAGRRVVDGLSFEVYRGEIFALLGVNGTGKTTAVEMLEGYRFPDEGSAMILGMSPWDRGSEVKGRVGVMLQDAAMYPSITPREALRLFARFYANPLDPGTVIETLGLQGAADTRFRNLSGGQKQRLALALALIGQPDVVFLDEPTAGMDPQSRRSTWDIMRRLKSNGVTVFLTTHYLEEAEQLADRVAIIHNGRLAALDTPAALMQSDASSVRLRANAPVDLEKLQQLANVASVTQQGEEYVLCTADCSAVLVELTGLLRELCILATVLRVGGGSLEDFFLYLP
ncbi:MAG: ABC transporter ATP-binding protein [Chloroflexota bacterium]